MHEESSTEKEKTQTKVESSLPRVNLDLTKFSKIERETGPVEERFASQETMNTHEEEIDLTIQNMITPLPNRERIIQPRQATYRSPSLKRERTKNSFTLTVPLESGRKEQQR